METAVELPQVVDLQPAEQGLATDSPQYQTMAKQIVSDLKEHGFAYIKNSIVSPQQVDELMKTADRFFDLPAEVKQKYQMDSNFKGKNGYMGIDFERLNQNNTLYFEFRESYNLYDTTIPLEPEEDCPGLQKVYYSFFLHAEELAMKIFKAVAVGLELKDESTIQSMFQNFHTSESLGMLRVLNYPPLSEDEVGEEVIRCGAHADYDLITFNFPDDVGGLEMIDRKSGKYVAVPKIEGTVLIQAGLALEKATDGLFTGTFHRVRAYDHTRAARRRSIAFFGQPDNNVRLKNLFKYHEIEDGDEKIATSWQFARQLYLNSFEKVTAA